VPGSKTNLGQGRVSDAPKRRAQTACIEDKKLRQLKLNRGKTFGSKWQQSTIPNSTKNQLQGRGQPQSSLVEIENSQLNSLEDNLI